MDPAVLSEVTGTDCHIAAFSSSAAHTTPLRKASITLPLKTEIPVLSTGCFLPLAPVQSDTYPSAPARSASVSTTASTPSEKQIEHTRRASSSSSSSGYRGLNRFLKLGPVHFGGEPGVGDYADMDEE